MQLLVCYVSETSSSSSPGLHCALVLQVVCQPVHMITGQMEAQIFQYFLRDDTPGGLCYCRMTLQKAGSGMFGKIKAWYQIH